MKDRERGAYHAPGRFLQRHAKSAVSVAVAYDPHAHRLAHTVAAARRSHQTHVVAAAHALQSFFILGHTPYTHTRIPSSLLLLSLSLSSSSLSLSSSYLVLRRPKPNALPNQQQWSTTPRSRPSVPRAYVLCPTRT